METPASPQPPQQNSFQPPSTSATGANAVPAGITNPASAPTNLPPFDENGEPVNPRANGAFPAEGGAPANPSPSPFPSPGKDSASENLPQSRSFDPAASPPAQGGEPFAASASPHGTAIQGSGAATAAAASAAQAAGLANVPENLQSHPDLDSFVQAAAQSEKTERKKRKPGRYGSVARILTIVIGLCVALVSLLYIDHKQDGIAVLHKIPGFGALSDKFGGMLASKGGDGAVANNGLGGAGAGVGSPPPANGGTPGTPPPAKPGTPPVSDAQLTREDATDNGEQTIPLNPDALNTDTLNNDAGTRPLAPGGEVSTTDPVPDPALATGGSPTASITESGTAQAGTNDSTGVDAAVAATPPRTEITPGVGSSPQSPEGTAASSGGDIVLTPPGQVGNGAMAGTTPGDGNVGSSGTGATPSAGGAAAAPGAAPLKTTPLPDHNVVPPATETGIGPLKANLPVDGELAEPRRAVTNYLDAPNWQARLPMIYKGDKLQSKISGYYESNPDAAISPYDLEFFHMEESAGPGKPYYIYFVTTPKVPQGFPAIVRRTPEGFKLDWECFVEFHDSHFVKFFDSKQEGPKSFRVVLKRAEYWGEDRGRFTDLDNYLCYRIELPYADLDYYAFVPRDQPLASELQGMVDWGKPPLAGIITFKRESFPHGASHLKITDFVTEDWYRPVD